MFGGDPAQQLDTDPKDEIGILAAYSEYNRYERNNTKWPR
jgi:hypothetical protein